MPARTMRVRHQDDVRAKIQCSELIRLLDDFINGKERRGKVVELSKERIRAIDILLSKSLPSLSSIDHTGNLTLTHEQQLEQLK